MGGKRVGILAPMVHEIEPFVRDLGMDEEGDHYIGMVDDTEIVAMVTNMGLQAGADAARRILQHDVDHVMVVGIAGGVDHSLEIGQVVVPERVLDRATGRMFAPIHVGDIVPRGTISCGDDLITDPATIAQWESEGVVAVEMETTGVAPVCEDAGVAWSVFRGISDFADGGLVDDEVFAMTNPDGTSDPEAMQRYLAENPEKMKVFEQLAHDMRLATDAAAAAAIRACATL